MIGTIVSSTIMVSVILLMLAAGLRITVGEMTSVIKRHGLVLRGVIANFVVTPALIYLAVRLLPIADAGIAIGIILMAAAPIAPMAPAPFVTMGKGDLPYSVGLMVIIAALSVVLTPLILSMSLQGTGDVTVDPWQIIRTLLIVQIIPISVGMAIRHFSPTWSARLVKVASIVGQVGLLVGVALLLAKQAPQILAIRVPAHIAMIAIVAVCLVVGHFMMIGQSGEMKRALAIVTAIRNIPLAFLIATTSFQDTIAGPVTLIFSVYTMVGAAAYAKLVMRTATASPSESTGATDEQGVHGELEGE